MLKIRGASVLVLFLSVIGAHASSVLSSSYDVSEDQHSQTRQIFLEMLKDPDLDSQSTDKLVEMLNSYRMDSVDNAPTIADAPFVGFVLENQIVSDWADQYKNNYSNPDGTGMYDQYITHGTDVKTFDLFMQAVVAGYVDNIPVKSLKDAGDSVGSCLAKRVEEAKDDTSCKLDSVDKPSLLSLGWMKYTCFLPFVTPACSARQAVFGYAKDQIDGIMKDGTLAKYFPQIYQAVFPGTVVNGAAGIQREIGDFISGKFGTKSDDDLWSKAPLIDMQDTKNRKTSLAEFATGLAADIRAASVLAKDYPQVAAPLFYASANRILTMMGGKVASWNPENGYVVKSSPAPGPSTPPQFETNDFGGFTFAKSDNGEAAKALDLTGYHPVPSASQSPSPLQLFPSVFTLGANSLPTESQNATESMSDMGKVMSALMDFLELTAPNTNLATHFIDVNTDPNASTKITDGTNPAIFPREGRALAVGMLAAIVQNMIAPNGHIVIPGSEPDNGTVDQHTGSFGFRYYNEIGFGGRIDGPVPISALEDVFSSASRLSRLVAADDPDLQAVKPLQDEINTAVEDALYSIHQRAQQPDGSFLDHLGDPSTTSKRNLDTQTAALGAFTTVYSYTGEGVLMLDTDGAWNYLDHFWPDGADLPVTAVLSNGSPDPDAGPLSAASAWALLNLWTQTQQAPTVYAALKADPNWDEAKWQTRFDTLRKQLEAQLDTSKGPQDLTPN